MRHTSGRISKRTSVEAPYYVGRTSGHISKINAMNAFLHILARILYVLVGSHAPCRSSAKSRQSHGNASDKKLSAHSWHTSKIALSEGFSVQ